MKKYIITMFTAVVMAFAACDNKPHFTIEGSVSDAGGRSIYLSHVGVDKTTVLDSVKIKGDGKFKFTQPQPESYDFYRLQLDGKGRGITLAIDSTETVSITINGKNFSENFVVEGGSPEISKIGELSVLRAALEHQVKEIIKNGGPALRDTRIAVYNLTKEFKENIFKQYIMPAPDKAAAYYALFLQIDGMPLFNPNANRFDSKCFAAVATSLNNRYPESVRAKNLYSIAMKGMQSTRPAVTDTIEVKEGSLSTTGLFEIKLPNVQGDSVSLSSLKGKVVLLDFTAYGDARVSDRTISLRELYNKYKPQGFEIYQVSFDGNVHFWKTSADNLPWVTVRDGDGASSSNALLYNVNKLPSYFLINRAGEIVVRDEMIKDITAEIEKLLKE